MAILLAIGVTVLFGYLEKAAINDWLRSDDDISVSMISAVQPKAPSNIATQGLALGIAAVEPTENAGWLDYRNRPTFSAFELLEPQAGIRLLAPQVADSGSLDVAREERSEPSELWSSSENARLVSTSKSSDSLRLEERTPSSLDVYTATDRSTGRTTLFPHPKQMTADIAAIRQRAQANGDSNLIDWCFQLESQIDRLREAEVEFAVVELDALHALAVKTIEALSNAGDLAEEDTLRLRVCHGIVRRFAVWKAVWNCLHSRDAILEDKNFEVEQLSSALDRIQQILAVTGDVGGWKNYLLLDDLTAIIHGDEVAVAVASQISQVVLSRITSINVNETQRKFLDTAEVHSLAESLQPLAIAPVDFRKLLIDLETVEENSEHRSRHTLIDTVQSLRFADNPKQAAVSQAIETYYRNANVRVAVSQKFATRMIPTNNRLQRPVRQTVLGADTRGNSQVDTTLSLRFIPDPSAWNIEIDLLGKIQSQTHSSRGPAIFFNSSNSQVSTTRTIRIDPQGIRVDGSQAKVQSQDALRGIETAYDGLPFVGEMVKYMASQQFQEKRGPAKRIMQRTIASQTDSEFDKQLDAKIKQAEIGFEKRLLGPLRNLDLNPVVSDLQTTSDRLIARYRIAGDNALAANTPRPQAPSDSLLSIQLHQSAINNGFSKLGLSDREWTLLELAQSLAHQFGQEPITELPTEVPSDVRVRFAGERPILVEFDEGKLRLTLNVALLTQGGRMELSDFVIRTNYIPGVSGLQSELIHEGSPSVDGDRISIRERLPLRLIFGKIFSARSNIPLIQSELVKDPRAEGLAISQIVLEQGWLAVAISEEQSPHVANLRQMQITR